MSLFTLLIALGGGAIAFTGAWLTRGKSASAKPSDRWVRIGGITLVGVVLGFFVGRTFGGSVETENFQAVAAEQEFDQVVLGSDRPVLVDFYSPSCPPCRQLMPRLDDLAGQYGDRVLFVKVDVTQASGLARRYGIRGVPTVKLFVDSQDVNTWVGVQSMATYRDAIDAALPAQAMVRPEADR